MHKLGSLFDGIGGFPYAWEQLGGRAAWASEIEVAPIAITRRHFPDMRHLGDITAIDGGAAEPVDVVTFGSPCQDLSVAGKREGLAGERSGLFMEAVRIIREMREASNGKHPAFAVWENVPGAFSSNGGEDFRAVLEELARVAQPDVHVPRPSGGRWQPAGCVLGKGWSIAWCVLDAQYWGVPQRRRRIFLVLDLGEQRAGTVLFERQGLPGHSAPGGEAGQRAAAAAQGGAGAAGFNYNQIGGKCCRSAVAFDTPQPSLTANSQGAVITATFKGGQGSKARGIGYSETTAPSLTAAASGSNLAPCCVAVWPEVNGTLLARDDSSALPDQINNICVESTLVRRLTPVECERLQGFPDDWTRWGLVEKDGVWVEVEIADSPRYRAIGNSVAIPCVAYVLAGVLLELEGR